jgi:hypothetical protein
MNMSSKNKQLLTTFGIVLAVSAAVVWASNNIDAIEDIIG